MWSCLQGLTFILKDWDASVLSGVCLKRIQHRAYDGISAIVRRNVIKMASLFGFKRREGFRVSQQKLFSMGTGEVERKRYRKRNLIKFKINRRNGDVEYTWLLVGGATCH